MLKKTALQTPTSPPAQTGQRRKNIKRLLSLVLTLGILGGAGYGVFRLLSPGQSSAEVMTDFVIRGMLQSKLTGYGVTNAKDSVTLAALTSSRVLEVNVKEGDHVEKGHPLYTLDDAEARNTVLESQKAVEGLQKQIDTLRSSAKDLTISTPFSGILTETLKLAPGDAVGAGTRIATLVDDTVMNLTLYFNYVYEDSITVGQTAQVSIPATMSQLTGTVTEIHKIRRPAPEGVILFEAVISLNNPGALADGMASSAVLTDTDGSAIYPYEPGKLAYARTADLVTKTSGEAATASLRNYETVRQGDVVLKLSADGNDDQITALENQLRAAAETLKKAQTALEAYHPTAPMGGTVLFVGLATGETAEAGKVAVTIADTSVMTVETQIDERNISNVKADMACQITQNGINGPQEFAGRVESVSLTGKSENGVSFFPAIVQVENPSGLLMSGMSVEYNLILAQSDDCLMVPIQAVQYTEQGACLFVRSETRPEAAVDLGKNVTVPAGFYAVPVTTGLSDNTNAEITAGVEDGTEVFLPSSGGNDDDMGRMALMG